MKNSNDGAGYKAGDFDYPIILIKRESEIVICTEDGEEIGSLYIQTMEKDISVLEACKKSFYLGLRAAKPENCVDSKHMAIGVYRD